MINRLLTLDSRLPIVWRTPDTLQIGFDPPRVVLTDIDQRLLVLLGEIHKGISDTGVWMLANQARLPQPLVQAFLDSLEPALTAPPATTPRLLVLDGAPDLTGPAREVLRGVGCEVFVVTARGETPPGEVLMYSHYTPNPHQFHSWLRQDRSHTPVIFTDQAVLIGPRIAPGHSRCLRCHFLGDATRHPYRVALASQLSQRLAHSGTPELARLATWHALQLLDNPEPNLQLRLSADTHAVTRTVSEAAGECSCLELS